jgi:hypothetical protein
MDVFLIPLGPDRHAPYCEVADGTPPGSDPSPSGGGWWRGLQERFREMLAQAEQRRSRADGPLPRSLAVRVRDWLLARIAERIAEQRLLWHLRSQGAARLVHPSDVAGERAMATLRADLQGDADRHLRWLFVDGALLVASGVLALVPGPNLIAYYFAFRVVGHWLSFRGARHGLNGVHWTTQASEALAELRNVGRLEPAQRARHVLDIESRLQLRHLSRFVERASPRSA